MSVAELVGFVCGVSAVALELELTLESEPVEGATCVFPAVSERLVTLGTGDTTVL